MNGPACENTRSPSCDPADSPDNDYYDAASFNETLVSGLFGVTWIVRRLIMIFFQYETIALSALHRW